MTMANPHHPHPSDSGGGGHTTTSSSTADDPPFDELLTALSIQNQRLRESLASTERGAALLASLPLHQYQDPTAQVLQTAAMLQAAVRTLYTTTSSAPSSMSSPPPPLPLAASASGLLGVDDAAPATVLSPHLDGSASHSLHLSEPSASLFSMPQMSSAALTDTADAAPHGIVCPSAGAAGSSIFGHMPLATMASLHSMMASHFHSMMAPPNTSPSKSIDSLTSSLVGTVKSEGTASASSDSNSLEFLLSESAGTVPKSDFLAL